MPDTCSPFGLSSEQVATIHKAFFKYPRVHRVVIFGSRAMGNFKPGSDVDLALFGDNLDTELLLELKAELNERIPLPHTFDLVFYDTIETKELQDHVDTYGKLFYERSDFSERFDS